MKRFLRMFLVFFLLGYACHSFPQVITFYHSLYNLQLEPFRYLVEYNCLYLFVKNMTLLYFHSMFKLIFIYCIHLAEKSSIPHKEMKRIPNKTIKTDQILPLRGNFYMILKSDIDGMNIIPMAIFHISLC